jgi:hypothetical protein
LTLSLPAKERFNPECAAKVVKKAVSGLHREFGFWRDLSYYRARRDGCSVDGNIKSTMGAPSMTQVFGSERQPIVFVGRISKHGVALGSQFFSADKGR